MESGFGAWAGLDHNGTDVHAAGQEGGNPPIGGCEVGISQQIAGRGGFRLGLGNGVFGQIYSVSVGRLLRVVKLAQTEQRGDPPPGLRGGGGNATDAD